MADYPQNWKLSSLSELVRKPFSDEQSTQGADQAKRRENAFSASPHIFQGAFWIPDLI
jgi:hypothetical protein